MRLIKIVIALTCHQESKVNEVMAKGTTAIPENLKNKWHPEE